MSDTERSNLPGGAHLAEAESGTYSGGLRTDGDGPTFVEGMTETRNFEDSKRPYEVVPERLVTIENREYVRCPTHGLIPLDHNCAKSMGDHYCRVAAHPGYDPATGEDGLDDQATPHDEWDRVQSDKLHYIAHLHSKGVNDDGSTTGFCAECEWAWPCRTVHMANGWGERHDCEDARWCKHAGEPLPNGNEVDDG